MSDATEEVGGASLRLDESDAYPPGAAGNDMDDADALTRCRLWSIAVSRGWAAAQVRGEKVTRLD